MLLKEGETVYFSVHYGGIIHKGEYLGKQEHVSWSVPGNRVKIIDNFGKTGFQVGGEVKISPAFKMITVDPYLDQQVDEETVEWIKKHKLPGYMERVANEINKKGSING